MRRQRISGCVLVILCTCGAALVAAEPATMPYRGLCESMGITFQADMARWPGELPFTIRSEAPGVKPADIRLVLQAGVESIPIPVTDDGQFTLPLDRKWFDADAVLVSNQPQGTLAMSCEFKQSLATDEVPFGAVSPHVENGRISYATLERLARQSRRRMLERSLEKKFGRDWVWRMKAAGRLDEIEEPADDPVILLFVKEGGAAANVAVTEPANPFRKVAGRWAAALGKKQDDVVRKVTDGMFLVHCPKELADKNPVLTLSDNPTWQCSLMDREADNLGPLDPSQPVQQAGATP